MIHGQNMRRSLYQGGVGLWVPELHALLLWLPEGPNHIHKPAKPYPQATGHSRCAYWVLLTKATLPGLLLKTAFPGLLFGGCWKGQTIPESNFGASKTLFRITRAFWATDCSPSYCSCFLLAPAGATGRHSQHAKPYPKVIFERRKHLFTRGV